MARTSKKSPTRKRKETMMEERKRIYKDRNEWDNTREEVREREREKDKKKKNTTTDRSKRTQQCQNLRSYMLQLGIAWWILSGDGSRLCRRYDDARYCTIQSGVSNVDVMFRRVSDSFFSSLLLLLLFQLGVSLATGGRSGRCSFTGLIVHAKLRYSLARVR